MKKIIYLSGACQNETYDGRFKWREECQAWVKRFCNNITAFSPVAYFDYSRNDYQSESEIFRYEHRKVKESSVILVNLKNIEKSVGTISELAWAYEHDIPIVGFETGDKRELHPWINIMCDAVFFGEKAMTDTLNYIKYYYD